MPKYTFHSRPQTNCEVFKWVPSITVLADRWLANCELITHTLALAQLTGFILNLGTQINFHPERTRCWLHALPSICALGYNYIILYFQVETAIIVSSNSECDTEDVRSRKIYMTPLARAKGKTFFRCSLLLRARSTLNTEQDSARYYYT